ncbi:hypothetical protein V2G26_020230 [Clonostachys chloroleuca]
MLLEYEDAAFGSQADLDDTQQLYNRDNLRHANRTHDWSNFYYSIDVYRKLDLHSADGSHHRSDIQSEFQQINHADSRPDPHHTGSANDRSEVKHINGAHDGIGVHYPKCFDNRLYFKCTNRAHDGPDVHYPRYFYDRSDFEHCNSAYNKANFHHTRRFFNRFGVESEFKYTIRAYDGPDLLSTNFLYTKPDY